MLDFYSWIKEKINEDVGVPSNDPKVNITRTAAENAKRVLVAAEKKAEEAEKAAEKAAKEAEDAAREKEKENGEADPRDPRQPPEPVVPPNTPPTKAPPVRSNIPPTQR